MSSTPNILQTIESISSIPTLPTVIDKITQLLQNPKTSAEEIGRAVTTDQSLASKVLKLVNSAFYGFPGRISTITHAIVILGFSTVKNIVLTASIFDAFRKKGNSSSGFDLEQFWMHSIACGAAAQSIARLIGSSEKEECFIAGLIHDIGKIVICHYLPEEFSKIIKLSQEKDILFYQSEKELFEVSHQEIGGYIAERWNLPKNLQNAVLHHHVPSTTRDSYLTTAIVHCADIFVRALDYGNGGDTKVPLMADHVWKNLGLENVNLPSLFDNISDDVEKATVFTQLT